MKKGSKEHESQLPDDLNRKGKRPENYSSKIDVELPQESSCRDAATMILKSLLNTMKLNEYGIKNDIDIEFLHDFRVSVRRIRSAITQLKKVFPEEVASRFKKNFSRIGKLTNKLRDCDVLLLEKENYMKMLPENLRPGAEPFFKTAAKCRKKELGRLIKELESQAYKKTVSDLKADLDHAASFRETENSNAPAVSVAKKIIHKRFLKAIKCGGKINEEASDKDFHALRIECKKLRYAMEFFASLFEGEKIAELVLNLKALQDQMGHCNDLSVQIRTMNDFLEKNSSSLSLAASIGGMTTLLHHEKMEIRKHFVKNFKKFAARKNASLFKKLFAE